MEIDVTGAIVRSAGGLERLPGSLLAMARTPFRVAHRLAGGAAAPEPAEPLDSGDLVVERGMPEGVPLAALRPEPRLPSPEHWPFGEHFPRTCGTGRLAAGAVFWTDFLYDDHGAAGVRVKMSTRPRGAAQGHLHLSRRPRRGKRRRHLPRRRSASPKRTPGGGSTGTRCSTRRCRSPCSRSTPAAVARPTGSGRPAWGCAPPESMWPC